MSRIARMRNHEGKKLGEARGHVERSSRSPPQSVQSVVPPSSAPRRRPVKAILSPPRGPAQSASAGKRGRRMSSEWGQANENRVRVYGFHGDEGWGSTVRTAAGTIPCDVRSLPIGVWDLSRSSEFRLGPPPRPGWTSPFRFPVSALSLPRHWPLVVAPPSRPSISSSFATSFGSASISTRFVPSHVS